MNSKILRKVQINKNETQVTTQIAKNKGMMTLKEVKSVINKIQKKGNDKYSQFHIPLIKILNGDKWASFKTLDDYNIYYEGKVANDDKFDDVIEMQITTMFAD